jgi:hypothetical protein
MELRPDYLLYESSIYLQVLTICISNLLLPCLALKGHVYEIHVVEQLSSSGGLVRLSDNWEQCASRFPNAAALCLPLASTLVSTGP